MAGSGQVPVVNAVKAVDARVGVFPNTEQDRLALRYQLERILAHSIFLASKR